MKSVKVWFVFSGLPGCLPNAAVAAPTKEAALTTALGEKRLWESDGYTVTGNIRRDLRYNVRQSSLIITVEPNVVELPAGMTLARFCDEYEAI